MNDNSEMQKTITTAVEFLNKLRVDGIVTVCFIKKDGSERVMKCTLNFKRIPKKFHPKNDLDLGRIVHEIATMGHVRVFDLDENEWRIVNTKTTKWLQVDETPRYNVSIK